MIFFKNLNNKNRPEVFTSVLTDLLQLSVARKDEYGYAVIFEKIVDELKKNNINTIISVIDRSKKNILVRHAGFIDQRLIIGKFKKIPLLELKNYQEVLTKKSALFFKADNNCAVKKILENNNISRRRKNNENLIIAPLAIKNEVIGFIELFSGWLDLSMVETVNKFARELTANIANVILFNEIKLSEERYRDLFENSKEGFFILSDKNRKFIEVNNGLCVLTGYTAQELAQMNYLLLFDCQERKKVKSYIESHCQYNPISRQAAPSDCETKIVTKKGETRYIEFKITRTSRSGEHFCIINDRTEKIIAEKIAKENAEMYHKLVKHANSIIFRRKLSGHITFMNEFALKFFGYSKKELIGKNVVGTIVPPFDSNGRNLKLMVRDISNNPERYIDNVNENMLRNGERVWIAWANKPIVDNKGKIVELLCIGHNITARKKAEEMIRKSEASLAEAQRIARLGNWQWDIRTNELTWSEESYRIFGLNRVNSNLTYDAFIDLVHPDDRELVRQSANQALAGKKIYSLDHRIIAKDGNEKIVHEQGEVTFSQDGSPTTMIGTVQDITDNVLAKKALIDSEEKYKRLSQFNQRILDNAPVSIITLDKEGKITSINKQAELIMNKMQEQQVGRELLSTLSIRQNDKLKKLYERLLDKGKPFYYNNLIYLPEIRKNRTYLNIIAVPLFDKNNHVEGVISMAIDNTVSVLAEEKLKRMNILLENKVAERTRELYDANKKLKKALELKLQFIADASHELRTPLTIIQGNLDLIYRIIKVKNKDLDECLNMIKEEIGHMAAIITNLAMLTNIDSNSQKVRFEKIGLSGLIKATCQSLNILAKEKNIELKYNISEININGDETILQKLLMNLIRNSIKYGKPNGLTKIWTDEHSNRVSINIEDNGMGIADEELPFIFERFYRTRQARASGEYGTGLGLAICKWIAQAHGGFISVESQLGQGSKFTVYLNKGFQN